MNRGAVAAEVMQHVPCRQPYAQLLRPGYRLSVDPVPDTPPGLRPQSLTLTFLGNDVLGRDVRVHSASVIDVRGGAAHPLADWPAA